MAAPAKSSSSESSLARNSCGPPAQKYTKISVGSVERLQEFYGPTTWRQPNVLLNDPNLHNPLELRKGAFDFSGIQKLIDESNFTKERVQQRLKTFGEWRLWQHVVGPLYKNDAEEDDFRKRRPWKEGDRYSFSAGLADGQWLEYETFVLAYKHLIRPLLDEDVDAYMPPFLDGHNLHYMFQGQDGGLEGLRELSSYLGPDGWFTGMLDQFRKKRYWMFYMNNDHRPRRLEEATKVRVLREGMTSRDVTFQPENDTSRSGFLRNIGLDNWIDKNVWYAVQDYRCAGVPENFQVEYYRLNDDAAYERMKVHVYELKRSARAQNLKNHQTFVPRVWIGLNVPDDAFRPTPLPPRTQHREHHVGNHWWFAVFDSHECRLMVYDSLAREEAANGASYSLAKNLAYLANVYNLHSLKARNTAPKNATSYEIVRQVTPTQEDAHSCGLFAISHSIKFLLHIRENKKLAKDWVSEMDDTQGFRDMLRNFNVLNPPVFRPSTVITHHPSHASKKYQENWKESYNLAKENVYFADKWSRADLSHQQQFSLALWHLDHAGAILLSMDYNPRHRNLNKKCEKSSDCPHEIQIVPVPPNHKVILQVTKLKESTTVPEAKAAAEITALVKRDNDADDRVRNKQPNFEAPIKDAVKVYGTAAGIRSTITSNTDVPKILVGHDGKHNCGFAKSNAANLPEALRFDAVHRARNGIDSWSDVFSLGHPLGIELYDMMIPGCHAWRLPNCSFLQVGTERLWVWLHRGENWKPPSVELQKSFNDAAATRTKITLPPVDFGPFENWLKKLGGKAHDTWKKAKKENVGNVPTAPGSDKHTSSPFFPSKNVWPPKTKVTNELASVSIPKPLSQLVKIPPPRDAARTRPEDQRTRFISKEEVYARLARQPAANDNDQFNRIDTAAEQAKSGPYGLRKRLPLRTTFRIPGTRRKWIEFAESSSEDEGEKDYIDGNNRQKKRQKIADSQENADEWNMLGHSDGMMVTKLVRPHPILNDPEYVQSALLAGVDQVAGNVISLDDWKKQIAKEEQEKVTRKLAGRTGAIINDQVAKETKAIKDDLTKSLEENKRLQDELSKAYTAIIGDATDRGTVASKTQTQLEADLKETENKQQEAENRQKEAEKKQKEAEKKRKELKKELKNGEEKQKGLEEELKNRDQKQKELEKQLKDSEEKTKKLEGKAQKDKDKRDQLETDLKKATDKLNAHKEKNEDAGSEEAKKLAKQRKKALRRIFKDHDIEPEDYGLDEFSDPSDDSDDSDDRPPGKSQKPAEKATPKRKQKQKKKATPKKATPKKATPKKPPKELQEALDDAGAQNKTAIDEVNAANRRQNEELARLVQGTTHDSSGSYNGVLRLVKQFDVHLGAAQGAAKACNAAAKRARKEAEKTDTDDCERLAKQAEKYAKEAQESVDSLALRPDVAGLHDLAERWAKWSANPGNGLYDIDTRFKKNANYKYVCDPESEHGVETGDCGPDGINFQVHFGRLWEHLWEHAQAGYYLGIDVIVSKSAYEKEKRARRNV